MKPYGYQKSCLTNLAKAKNKGQKRALVVMATGLGKTVVSALDVKRLIAKNPGRVLYLCHDKRILRKSRQTYEEILGKDYSYGYFHGTEKHLHEVDVLFATFQTMANWREAFLKGEFRYVVVDEVHHGHAATFRPTIEYFEPEWMVGYTATPEREDGLDITEIFGKPVFNLGIFKALAKRYLCDVDYRVMTDEIQNAGVLDTPVGKLSIALLNRTIFIPKRDEEIVRIIGEKIAEVENPRTIIFCASIVHAERLMALMHHAVIVHSKLSDQENDKQLAAFSSGEVDTILTVDMLNEGIDVPEANVLVFLRSTASRRIFLQQFGRGLRKALGKLKVLVLDFVANCERIEMIDQLQKGVEAETKALPSGTATDETAREREAFTLTLDGVEFDERVWRLFEVIHEARQSYTTEQLIKQLQELKARLGRVPTAHDIRKSSESGETATQSTFVRLFGSLNAALEAAGFRPNRVIVEANRAQLIEQLHRLREHVQRIPTPADLNTHRGELRLSNIKAFSREFGDWESGLTAAGFDANEEMRLSILVQLEALMTELGTNDITKRDLDAAPRDRYCNSTTVIKCFGSWNAAKTALGARTLNVRTSKTEALKKLRELAQGLSDGVSHADILRGAAQGICPDPQFYTKNFGSIEAACKEAEVVFAGKQNTVERLTAQMRRKVEQLGRRPQAREVTADREMASAATFMRAFSTTWNGVFEAMGL